MKDVVMLGGHQEISVDFVANSFIGTAMPVFGEINRAYAVSFR